MSHTPARPRHLASVLTLAILFCLAVAAVHPTQANAQRNIEAGLFDDAYVQPAHRLWLDRTRDAGATSVRIPVRWKWVAQTRPTNPRNHTDPKYNFNRTDNAVRAATARGLNVVLNLTTAPNWAQRGTPDPRFWDMGAWDPDPVEFRHFAEAVARRYNGVTAPVRTRVVHYEIFNEPNYGLTHLGPQWRNGKPYGVELYRKLLNNGYAAIKAVHSGNKVIGPSLGPQGTTPNRRGTGKPTSGVRPLFFLRELFCLKHNRKMTPKRCPAKKKPRFDVLSHHPINRLGSPRAKASHRDSVIGGDIPKLRKVLRRAEKAGNLVPRKLRRPIWITEFWWETNPPNRKEGVRPMQQARNLAESLYVFWRAGVQRAYWFRIKDTGPEESGRGYGGAAGLHTDSGNAKPSLTAFRFPFVADRRGKRKVLAWGKAPVGGQVRVERKRPGGWKTVARTRGRAGQVFTQQVRLKGKAKLRATIAGTGERSLLWPVKKR